jgi:chloramphenicol-sensitive protein RarD
MEVVANRIVWALVFLIALLLLTRSMRSALAASRSGRTVAALGLAAVVLAVNWGTYVYAVESDQVVEASLGYFINPLVSVALGVLLLRERLRRGQWAAVGVALAAVVVLTVSYGHPPWISLILAFSFGFYGLIKKQVAVPAMTSLAIETAVLLPVALLALAWFASHGQSSLLSGDTQTFLLLAMLGPVTAVPLLAFAGSARRIPLSTLGLIQYVTPVVQFLIAVLVFQEPMSTSRWLGFVLVWASLAVMTFDGLRHARNRADDLEVVDLD